MGQTLTHGIYLPDEGERNCYNGLAGNWSILDGAVGTVAEHTSQIAGKAPAVHTHTKADITDFPAYGNTAGTICEGNDSRLSDARTPVAHTHGKADITDLFNSANVWDGDQTATGTYYVKSTTWEKGVEPSSSSHKNIYFVDKNNATVGTIRRRIANGSQSFQFFGSALVKNGQLDPTGDSITWGFSQVFLSNGSTYFQFDGNIGNSIVPRANNSYDLGSSSNQWNNLYAKNYYYNGTAWGLDKANTWTQINDFKTLRLYGAVSNNLVMYPPAGDKGDSSTFGFNIICSDKNLGSYTVSGVANIGMGQSGGTSYVALNASTKGSTDNNNHSIQIGLQIAAADNANTGSFYPTQNGGINLGTSTNKWKSLNGINPGALSLPDYNRFEPIDFSQYDVNLGWNNLYTPSEDGWLYAEIDDTATNSIYIYSSGLQPVQSVNRKYGVSAQGNGSQSGYGGRLAVMVPVRKDIQYRFLIKASAVSDIYAVIFYPCLGNV